ncbi:MAG: transglycosylase SLT domain-containing protein, partial [Holophagales bacterium]|nr:transglycosylase SLT domain-containing protein [Holophagales bacterium]
MHRQLVDTPDPPAPELPGSTSAAAALVLLLATLAPVSALAQGVPGDASPVEVDRLGSPLPVAGWRDLDPRRFPVPHQLQDNVAFWTKVYTEYDDHVVLLHDDRHLGVIYAALDFQKVDDDPGLSRSQQQQIRRERISRARSKYRSILQDLAAGRESKAFPNDQARIAALFDKVPGGRKKYSSAVGRMRTQTCLRNRFAEAIERSGYYMVEMERIFRRHDLPVELTRLPFVESLFQWWARSSAAAGGIWQFMPGTARLYMEMNAEVDERFDPLTATDGAARLLGENHAALGTWPLAITAYNHGRYGMKRAV